MYVYFARRLLYAAITFFGITVATFALIHAIPGDPIDFYVGMSSPNSVSHAALAAIRRENHLDEPLPIQYLYWVRGIVRFDFGRSIIDHVPVSSRIAQKLPNTVVLNVLAFVVAAVIGLPLGLWSATQSGRPVERGTSVFFFLLYSLPSFWVALLLMRLFAVRWDVLPLFGMTSDNYRELDAPGQLLDRLRHAVLPVITLSLGQIAIFARYSHSALAEVIRQDFITTARAKGVAPGGVLWNHAFRNALIPLITLLGLTIPYLLSGSVIVEQIFQWDGIGRLYVYSILSRDYPTVLALSVATALVTLLAALLGDLLYVFADPRVRLQEGRG